jgi:hypothetical protein
MTASTACSMAICRSCCDAIVGLLLECLRLDGSPSLTASSATLHELAFSTLGFVLLLTSF